MKHKHADIIKAIAEDWEVKLEFRHEIGLPWLSANNDAIFYAISQSWDGEYRIAPNTIRIGGMDVPKPMQVAPAYGTAYWIVNLFCINLNHINYWCNNPTDLFYLKRGICHINETNCRIHAEALIKLNGGTL